MRLSFRLDLDATPRNGNARSDSKGESLTRQLLRNKERISLVLERCRIESSVANLAVEVNNRDFGVQ